MTADYVPRLHNGGSSGQTQSREERIQKNVMADLAKPLEPGLNIRELHEEWLHTFSTAVEVMERDKRRKEEDKWDKEEDRKERKEKLQHFFRKIGGGKGGEAVGGSEEGSKEAAKGSKKKMNEGVGGGKEKDI